MKIRIFKVTVLFLMVTWLSCPQITQARRIKEVSFAAQEIGEISHEIRGLVSWFNGVIKFLIEGGARKEIFDELERIFEEFHSDTTGANIYRILNSLFYQLSEDNIERLKISMRSEVADKFEVFGEIYDQEQLLSNFSYLGRAIRLFSGYYMGKEALRKSHIRLNDVLMACCAGSQAFDQAVTKVFQTGNINVYTDEVALFQIIRNLLSNALEATDINRENRITIRTYLSNDSNFVFIQVEDRGIGIPEENLSRIFTSGFTTKERGKGLGLAIIKNLVEVRCNGTIKVQSKVGSGTIFTICLPIL